MPTVILLDVSLSMCQPLQMTESGDMFEIRNLAVQGLTSLLDYMTVHCKLEFVSLIVFSSLWEVMVQFTRDFESVKTSLSHLEIYDRTSIIKALDGASTVIMEEWGAGVPTQVLLITDGGIEGDFNSIKVSSEKNDNGAACSNVKDVDHSSFPLPFPFPCKLHILCINDPTSPYIQTSLPMYQKLINLNNGGGELFLPEVPLTEKSVLSMFQKLAEVYYKPFHGILSCGHLSSHVSLSPPPEAYDKAHDFEWVHAEMSTEISICGFIDISDVSSPPSFSRHLVLPIPSAKEETKSLLKMEKEEAVEEDTSNEDGKQPSFCVLLHGSLKVEGMVAICNLGENWYGMLYSWADSKKKSNLMLSAFEPGLNVIPWLGNFENLGPVDGETRSFPVMPSGKRSYSQNCVVWIKQSGLQADIQKILRHARKLPEKTQHFYKELNRLRRAALAFGFYELLEGMANILDRECTMLPGSAHPDAALQLTHSANILRSPNSQDYDTPVVPLRTKFSVDD